VLKSKLEQSITFPFVRSIVGAVDVPPILTALIAAFNAAELTVAVDQSTFEIVIVLAALVESIAVPSVLPVANFAALIV